MRTAALSSIETRVFKLLCAIRRDPLYCRIAYAVAGSSVTALSKRRQRTNEVRLSPLHWEVITLKHKLWASLALVMVVASTPGFGATPTTPGKTPSAPPKAAAPAKPAPSRPAPSASDAQRVDAVAAYVNDDIVLESDVEEQLTLFLMRSQAMPDSFMQDTLRKQILNQLIDEKLIVAEAKRLGVTTTEAEVSRQVEDALREVKQRLGSEEAFQEQMRKENTNEAKLREKYRVEVQRQLLLQKLVAKQLPKKNVTTTEAEAYFKENHAKFPKVPAEVKVQVIQIPAAPDSATDKKARDKALEARRRVAGGEKFAKVASEMSDDTNSARSGGDIGFFPKGAMDPTIEATAFGLKDGEISQPVRSVYGWHIVQTIERDTMKTRAGKDSLDAKGVPVLEVHARHVLIRTNVTEADADRARQLAEKVHNEALKGTDFGTLVRRYSKYQGQVGPDGDLGFISLGTLQPSIRAGLDTLELGQVSEVMPNAVGFNIFKVNDRKPEREYRLDEIKDDLTDVVAQMKQRDRYEDWVKGLRAKAHIRIASS